MLSKLVSNWLIRKLLAVSACAALSVPSASGQGTAGSITGVIKDETGAVIQGVQVVAQNEDTGQKTTSLSQADGRYQATQLRPGTYRILVSAEGFKKLEISGIKVDVDTAVTNDVTLTVGAVADSIQV